MVRMNFIVNSRDSRVRCLVSSSYEWRHAEPIVDVAVQERQLRHASNLVMFMVGAISFASTV